MYKVIRMHFLCNPHDTPGDVISPRNLKLLNEFAPELVDSMDALALLPYLMRYGLANRHDQEFISNSNKTSLQQNLHIIHTAPFKDSNAFERFVKCLEEVGNEFASQLRQRISKLLITLFYFCFH